MYVRLKNENPIGLSVVLLLGSLFLTNTPVSIALEATLASGQVLDLYGIGIHQEKRNDIYLGAIFAPPGTKKVAQLISEKNDKRMSFKFLSKYSNRKMSRLLKQRIAMNNSKDQWSPYTAEIVQFANLFKRSLQSGDEMNIDFTADKGTQIYLNNTLFQSVEKLGFYKILLNIWFGSIPPSESFKTGINGMNTDYLNDELVTKYNNLKSEIGRFDGDKITIKENAKNKVAIAPVKTESSSRPATKQTTVITQDERKQPVTSDSSDISPILTPAAIAVSTAKIVLDSLAAVPVLENQSDQDSSNILKDLATTEIDESKTSDTEQELDNAILESPNAELNIDANNKPTQEGSSVVQDNQQEPNATKPEQVAKVESPQRLDLDLISGSYSKELFSIVRAKQRYPSKALREGIEGKVVVRITIDKEGEVVNQELIKRSGSRVLDRGVLKMLRRSGPFPKIPDELNLEEFSVELPLAFQFAD